MVVGAGLVVVILGVVLLASVIAIPHPAQPKQGLQSTTSQGTVMGTSSLSVQVPSATQTMDTLTISPKGRALIRYIDSLNVTTHWLASKEKVNWSTGDPDPTQIPFLTIGTHCSSFVAGAVDRLGIPILTPTGYTGDNFVNAQVDWLNSKAASDAGWTMLPDAVSAQASANQGNLVVSAYKGPDQTSTQYESKFGHVAVVRPYSKTRESVLENGTQVAEAGWENSADVSIKLGYAGHPGAWVGNGKGAVQFFMHPVPNSALAPYY